MRAAIITIEGTDSSGKETQSKKIYEKLLNEGYKVKLFSFPDYSSPTGKIIGGPYLGKEEICEGFFEEGAPHVDPLVASLYFAADRRYNFLKEIGQAVNENECIILDRYVGSNLAHQGSKIEDKAKQDKFFDILHTLEHDLCELPLPDLTLFLHMPYEAACLLKKNRVSLDQHEKDATHLLNAEKTYLRLCEKFDWEYINCLNESFKDADSIKTPDQISQEIYKIIESKLTKDNELSKLTMTNYN